MFNRFGLFCVCVCVFFSHLFVFRCLLFLKFVHHSVITPVANLFLSDVLVQSAPLPADRSFLVFLSLRQFLTYVTPLFSLGFFISCNSWFCFYLMNCLPFLFLYSSCLPVTCTLGSSANNPNLSWCSFIRCLGKGKKFELVNISCLTADIKLYVLYLCNKYWLRLVLI